MALVARLSRRARLISETRFWVRVLARSSRRVLQSQA